MIVLSELAAALQTQAIERRRKENELLEDIAEMSDYETAEAAADIYSAEKHVYSFDGYLYKLSELRTVLAAGVPADVALEAVDSIADAQIIIHYYKGGEANANNFHH